MRGGRMEEMGGEGGHGWRWVEMGGDGLRWIEMVERVERVESWSRSCRAGGVGVKGMECSEGEN
jgi:hypothetical protein